MSLIPSGFAKSAAAAGFYSHPIEQSLRFNDDDSAYLSWTPASAGNRKTWTWSGWVKRGNLGTGYGDIFGTAVDSGDSSGQKSLSIGFTNTNVFTIDSDAGASLGIASTSVFRDVSSWYHIVVAMDTTQATSTDRIKVYVNGERITAWSTSVFPAQNLEPAVNRASAHYLGRDYNSYFDGYLAEVNFIDGQALDPTSFGEFKSGVWIPKAYSGSYGTNGFYLDFDGTYYNDKSGNGNNFTANNLAATDVVLDSPTNNFATFSPLLNRPTLTDLTYQEGNLKVYSSGRSDVAFTGFAPTSGKWYVEALKVDGTRVQTTGLVNVNNITGNNGDRPYGTGNTTYDQYIAYRGDGIVYVNSLSSVTTVSSYTAGDIVGFAIDIDAGSVALYKNGSLQYTATSVSWLSEGTCFYIQPDDDYSMANFGQDSSFAGNKTAQGNTDANGYGDFYYAPPTGYLALCTANLEVPDAMNPALDASPQDYFNTVLYTGNGSTQSITGVGFQPDFVWTKGRNFAIDHGNWDSVRGATKHLRANGSAGEGTLTDELTSFDSDGFSLGASGNWITNRSGYTYVAWNWKANGSGVSNTDGSITSTVSANTDAGFSIVSYTGTGSTATVGHGLSSAPEMILVKNRDSSYSWSVYFNGSGAAYLDLTDAFDAGARYTSHYNGTAPTSSVFSLGTSVGPNESGSDHIAYCFHSVEGFSKFGKYTGNGSTDGPFVYTGFRPAFVIWKRTDSTSDWNILDSARDPYNDVYKYLYAASNAEAGTSGSSYALDFVSNGFKIRGSGAAYNTSGATIIYMAFAENPFKYSTAR